jgi:ribosomal-protein-alanine N-acetyltransferase
MGHITRTPAVPRDKAAAPFESRRLRFQPLGLADLDVFHAIVQDAHVRRYLLDDEIQTREWSEARIRASSELFAEHGIGLWLVSERDTAEVIGFCGFLVIPALRPEPQLLYAMYEKFTGRGYATEMASSAIVRARNVAGFEAVYAGVDEPNLASRRVLAKLGFEVIATVSGQFGKSFVLRLLGPPGV